MKGSPPGGNAGDESKNRCESSRFWGSGKLMAGFVFVCLIAYLRTALVWPWRTWFFSIVSSGDNIVTNRCVTSAWESKRGCVSLDPCPGSSQASRLPQQFMMTPGGSSLARDLFSPLPRTPEGMVGVFSPFTPSPGTALGIVRQVRKMLSCSIEMSDQTWVSVSFPQAQLRDKETDLLEMYTNQNLLC